MNLLGIDFGKKRVGLAWVATGLNVVLPFGQLISQEPRAKSQELIKLIKKEKIDQLVIGLPLGTDGKENENTARVRAFAEQLKKDTGLPLEFVDERFTTAEAKRMGGEATLDEKAAMLVLETYLKLDKV